MAPLKRVGSPEAKELQARFRLADIPYRFHAHKIQDRIDVIRGLICDSSGYRTIQVNRRCVNFINEITEGYHYPDPSSKARGDNPSDENNHCMDSFGYWAYVRAKVI